MMLALSLSAGAVVRPAVSGRVTRGARTPVRAIRVAAGATRVSTVAKLTTETESSSFQMPEFKAEQLAAFGAFTALQAANPCLAATEFAEVADGRLGIFFLLFGPVLGWVAFNILGPALNQLDTMDDKNTKKRALIGGVGITAAMLAAAPSAEAAQQVAEVADGRLGIFFLLFGPVVGWVAFNILGPGLNQLDTMDAKNSKKRALIGGAGITAAMLSAVPSAEAAQQVAEVADGRLGIFFLLFGPVVGWVAFNILGPGLNQLDTMDAKNNK